MEISTSHINKQRNAAIDVFKAFATLMVINSHMGICYIPGFEIFASGGAIGNSLFFFCSGFTLFLSSDSSGFINWYKNRINRIIPSLIAIAIIVQLIWENEWNITYVLSGGGYWFIQCIFVYYILLYPIKKYFINKLWLILLAYSTLFLLIYFYYFYPKNISFYGDVTAGVRQIYYFLFMLLGSIMAYKRKKYSYRPLWLILFTICFVSWYAMMALFQNSWIILLSLIPLLGICYFGYLVATAKVFTIIMNNKWLGNTFFIIGALSLESYLIQFYMFTDSMNNLFPLNIPFMILIILVSAYLLKMFSTLIKQTFQSEPYDLNKLLIYKR